MDSERRTHDDGPPAGTEERRSPDSPRRAFGRVRFGVGPGLALSDDQLLTTPPTELRLEVRRMEASNRRRFLRAFLAGCVVVGMALLIALWLLSLSSSTNESNADRIERLQDQVDALTDALDAAQLRATVAEAATTEQARCENRFTSLRSIASQDYFAELGDLVVAGVGPTKGDPDAVGAAIGELVNASDRYDEVVNRSALWSSLPRSEQSDCPVTDDELRNLP